MSDLHLELDGTIIDSTKGIFRVELDQSDPNELDQSDPNKEKTVILCTIAGKLRMNKINLLVGDYVKVKISPYDLNRGIIFHRHKKPKK